MTFQALVVFYIFERCVGDALNCAPRAAVARALRALSSVIFARPVQPQNAHWKTMKRLVCFSFLFSLKKSQLQSLGDIWVLLPQN